MLIVANGSAVCSDTTIAMRPDRDAVLNDSLQIDHRAVALALRVC